MQEEATADVRRKHIMILRDHLYGTLGFDDLKPHIVLQFFELLSTFDGIEHAKTKSYQLVSDKFSISVRTVAKLVKEYEANEVFSKSKRGAHPKTIWALQNEKARGLFTMKVRELREHDPETAK